MEEVRFNLEKAFKNCFTAEAKLAWVDEVGKATEENAEDSGGDNLRIIIREGDRADLGGKSSNAVPIFREVLFLNKRHVGSFEGGGEWEASSGVEDNGGFGFGGEGGEVRVERRGGGWPRTVGVCELCVSVTL